ncbi:hypothetical protein IP91_01061 [Pseudoduganella lurida]|uniref:Uncharacterized protein n=1 Tax=Pseudoduganella lurida TaxID=1036180 RepID=A0A562RM72_9BURK|nr:hypothetical protein [Pseudoduganella lurida]TWI69983.1 hypothetical protein IP91_01061 [Pseudoduganella lurida]
MGNSLHNKIYLGRRVDRMRFTWAGIVAGLGLLLLTLKAFK